MTATSTSPSRIGVGLYSVSDAARLLRVPAQRVRRWMDPQEELIQRTFPPEEGIITFLELMELHFIQMFRQENVSLLTIRRAAKTAARKYEQPYPFTLHRFDTDGQTIFATLSQSERRRRMVEDLEHGQFVFEKICRPFFRKLDYQQDDPEDNPIRFWPLNKNGRVVLDPQRRFGRPIDAPTGVPTQALYLAVKAREDQSTVATWFNVPSAAVAAAFKFEESLAA